MNQTGRRTAWRTLAALCVSAVMLSLAGGRAHAVGRPNVLVIITDDQGYGDFSLHGNPHVRTLHLDRLGESGVRFDRFFVNSFCAPTRAALLTGRYPLRTGVHGVTHHRETMKADEVTLAEALGNAGYDTACIGKWHNGGHFPHTARGQGFQQFFGFNGGHWNGYFDATLLRDAQPVPTQGFITDVLTDEALRFMSADRTKPFFCYLAFNAPHSPFQVPDRYFDRFKAKGFDETVAAFWGMCENVDDNVGRLLAKLDEKKLAENTIVVFLTDNGGTAGVKLYNAGMRGGKTSVHEGGTRVPLFVKWPAAKWSPRVVRSICAHIDLYPTLLDLCGVTPPAGPRIDGVSLRPLLEGKEEAWPERVLFTHNPIHETNKYPGAVRTPRYRLVREIKGAGGGSAARGNDANATPWQLYDMSLDPGQERDLAGSEPKRVAELSQLYDAWYADISRDGVRRMPIPVGHLEQNPVVLRAPEAYYKAPLKFHAGPGFANDWLTNWTNTEGRVWFEIDVARAGWYEAEIAYTCETAQAGSRIALGDGRTSVSTVVPGFPAKAIALPHRDEKGHERYQNRVWGRLKLGRLNFSRGVVKLQLEANTCTGSQVLDFFQLQLTAVNADSKSN